MAHIGGFDYGEKLPAMGGGVTSSTALAIRNSTIIAHRLSIYLPQLLLPTRDPQKLIMEINCHVAQFRELLIFIGQTRDSPELREKIRRLRRSCVDACKQTAHLITPQSRHSQPASSSECRLQLQLLYQLTQQFRHELIRSHRLIQLVPYDMTDYYAPARGAPSNLGNVISQILLCKQINPDFQQEELCSISKDAQELSELLGQLESHLPSPAPADEPDLQLDLHLPHSCDVNLAMSAWYKHQRRRSCRSRSRSLCCCLGSSQAN
ncbi:uncharacterized protein LOC115765855 [Drosophila novamexicana]|uniref:uncharacterized protein LOC115765855 n=1 Tax=Drosophila novamexicana TaxID=47314 RepID=UPI0011E5B122|nr:uncharacterized protein LOC115765855 [Drosophila novamexicana]